MTRRRLFHEADLARAIRVAQAAGLTVTRFEIDPTGGIKIECSDSGISKPPEISRVEAAVDAAIRRARERRRAREEAKAAGLSTRGRPPKQK